LHLNDVLEMHDHVGVYLLMGKVDMLPGVVQLVLGLTKAAICDLQLKVLCRLTCPMTEEGVLTIIGGELRVIEGQ
jgi:hypothetical protein